jgi:hypothetical protein
MQSRIPFKINFPDFTDEELADIFIGFCAEKKLNIADSIRGKLIQSLKNYRRKENESLNARIMRNLFEKTLLKRAQRLAQKENVNKNDLQRVLFDDFALNDNKSDGNVIYLKK